MLYLKWVTNVVLVKKANGQWRICIYFMDVNKECLKDNFTLPRIYQLVDATVDHELSSFIDAYSGYNQIQIDEGDQDKTSFTID